MQPDSLNPEKTFFDRSPERDGVSLFLLPDNKMRWPTFFSPKQLTEACQHMFFQRVSPVNKFRMEKTVNLLRGGKKVICTGLAGIGKSTEMNAYLMGFIKHLGETGWPPEVWYRVEKYYTNLQSERIDLMSLLKQQQH
jgi:hypothetical protein